MAADDITAQTLTGAGVHYRLAAEIIAALKTGKTADPVKLMSHGLTSTAAIELANEINARAGFRRLLHQVGFPTGAADAIVNAITAAAT